MMMDPSLIEVGRVGAKEMNVEGDPKAATYFTHYKKLSKISNQTLGLGESRS